MREKCISASEDGQINSAELLVILPVFLLLPRSVRWMMSPRKDGRGGAGLWKPWGPQHPREALTERGRQGAPQPRGSAAPAPLPVGPARPRRVPPSPAQPRRVPLSLWTPHSGPRCCPSPPVKRSRLYPYEPWSHHPRLAAGLETESWWGKILLIWDVLSSDGSR